MNYFIPEILISQLKPLLEIKFPLIAKYHLSKCYYIIDKLYLEHHINKLYDRHSFINLNSQILKDLFGSDYYISILVSLKDLNIIESDNDYKKGLYSFGFRLTKEYMNVKFKLINDDSKFSSKIESYKLKKINSMIETKDNVYHQKLLNLKDTRLNYSKLNYLIKDKISIINKSIISINNYLMYTDLLANETYKNIENLTNIINELNDIERYNTEKKEYYINRRNDKLISKLTKKKKRKKEKDLFGIEKFESQLISIINLLRIEYDANHTDGLFFTIDKKGNRVHDNISNLSSEVRECLYQNNNKEVVYSNVDLKCSQILMLIIYLKNTFPNFYAISDFKLLEDFYNNDFYNSAMNDLNYTGTRKQFKVDFFSKVYFSKQYRNDISDWFSSKFPNVFSVINELKHSHYSNFAIKMQQTESAFIYYEISKLLNHLDEDGNKPYKDLYFLTIHDSIIIDDKLSNMIKDRLEKEIYSKYNIKNTTSKTKLDRFKISNNENIINKLKILNEKLKSHTI